MPSNEGFKQSYHALYSGRPAKSNAPLYERFAADPPAAEQPSSVDAMAHRLKTHDGKAIYAQRKSTVDTVFGIIKQVQ